MNSQQPTLQTSGVLAGLDIGGTKTAVLLTDLEGLAVARAVQPTAVSDDPAQLVSGVAATVRQTLREAGLDPAALRALGAGVPGLVDSARGTVRLAVNLRLRDFPFGAALGAALHVPVLLDNDVRAAAQGAYDWLSAQRPLRSMAYLSLGTGIAAGLVLDGRVWRGSHGLAGEVGHIIVEPGGTLCPCGQRGCLETVAAGPAIGRAWPGGDGTAQAVFAAAEEGDAAAQAVIERAAGHIARAIYGLALTLDLDAVTLGGGVTQAGEPFLAPLKRELEALRRGGALAKTLLPPDFVQPVPAAADVACWGAIALARQALTAG